MMGGGDRREKEKKGTVLLHSVYNIVLTISLVHDLLYGTCLSRQILNIITLAQLKQSSTTSFCINSSKN